MSGYVPMVDGAGLDDLFGPAQQFEPLPAAHLERVLADWPAPEWGERRRLRDWLWGGRPAEQHR